MTPPLSRIHNTEKTNTTNTGTYVTTTPSSVTTASITVGDSNSSAFSSFLLPHVGQTAAENEARKQQRTDLNLQNLRLELGSQEDPSSRTHHNSLTEWMKAIEDIRRADAIAIERRFNTFNEITTKRLDNIQNATQDSLRLFQAELKDIRSLLMHGIRNSESHSYPGTNPDNDAGPLRSNFHADIRTSTNRNSTVIESDAEHRTLNSHDYHIDNYFTDRREDNRVSSIPSNPYHAPQLCYTNERSSVADKVWGAPKLTAPIFKGNNGERPMRFLQEFKKYCETLGPRYDFRALAEQSLCQIAREWWSLVEIEIRNWTDFEYYFTRRFWNEDIQHQVRESLEYGWYNPESKQKRFAYAIHLIGIARELTPRLTEEQIIKKLARHFTEEIRGAILARGIRTTTALLDFLETFDQGGAINSQRRRYENNNNNTYGNNASFTASYNNNNNRNFIPSTSQTTSEKNTTVPKPGQTNVVSTNPNSRYSTPKNDTPYKRPSSQGQQVIRALTIEEEDADIAEENEEDTTASGNEQASSLESPQ